MYLDHFNNNIWTPECTVKYEETCIRYSEGRKEIEVVTESTEYLQLSDEQFISYCENGTIADLLTRSDDMNFTGNTSRKLKELEKRLDTLHRLRIKAFFPQGDIKILSTPYRITYKQLHDSLVNQYLEDNKELSSVAFKISYFDSDDDRINITTDNDWRECLALKRDILIQTYSLSMTAVRSHQNLVKLKLICISIMISIRQQETKNR